MSAIKCAIIDDEPLAIEVVQSFVEKVDCLELLFTAQNPLEGLQRIKDQQPDLVFLDIQMPEIDGLSFFKTLTNPPFVIFTTAYREYAVEGFELNALDYLVKPISFQRFVKSIDRVLEELNKRKPIPNPVATEVLDQEVIFKVDKKIIKIPVDNIQVIQGLKDYIRVKTTDQDLISYQTIKGMVEALPESKFVRIHKSYIVNLDHVKVVEGNTVQCGEHLLTVSRNYRKEFIEQLTGSGIRGSKLL